MLYSNPMRENYTLTRLYIEASLKQDALIALTKEQAHYLGTVLRRKAGEDLRVFNAESGEWLAQVADISRKSGTLKIVEPLRAPQKAPDIWLCFAPVRKHRTAFIIEKGTELGVSEFHPIITQRTQFPRLNVDKARLQAIEAAEQTERLDLPFIHAAHRGGVNDYLAGWNMNRPLIFADEAGDAKPALEALKTLPSGAARGPALGPAAILIGPEGGFTDQEREILRAKDFVMPVSLGPRILRADTAALALLTLWQGVYGDWCS